MPSAASVEADRILAEMDARRGAAPGSGGSGSVAASSPERTNRSLVFDGTDSPTGGQHASTMADFYGASHATGRDTSRTSDAGTDPSEGKAFFRLARNRLNYSDFCAFLAEIKKLNMGNQTREECLNAVQPLLDDDLLEQFHGLLSRHRAS